MKQINLLPKSIMQRAAQRRLIPLFLIAVAVGCAFSGLVWAFWVGEKSQVNDQLVEAKAELERQARAAKESAEAFNTEGLSKRIDELNTLSASEVNWSETFAAINAVIPEDIRIVTLSAVPETDGVSATMSGVAPNSVSFATFHEGLRSLSGFKDIEVESFVYNPSGGTVSFSVSGKIPQEKVLYQSASKK